MMKLKKRFMSVLLSVLLAVSMLPMSVFAKTSGELTAQDTGYVDVSEDAYYAEAVAKVKELGIMSGLRDSVFGPTEYMSRAMVATVLYRYAGSETPENPGSKYFLDCASDTFYDLPTGWGKESGVITGLDDGTFRPALNVTRQEFATMLYRYYLNILGETEVDGADGYPDAQTAQDWKNVASFAKKAITWCVDLRIIRGLNSSDTDMIINPTGYLCRADAAVMISRFCELFEEEEEEPNILKILYTNDVHTYIESKNNLSTSTKELSYASIAQMKKDLEEQGENVLLVDAGDHVQGTAYGAMDKGQTITELMQAAGYDLATLGNHEFDYGMARALEVVADSDFPYISCNFLEDTDYDGTWNQVLDSYKIFDYDGTKVAFVGITTPQSITSSTPAYFQDEDGNWIYKIASGDDGAELYDAVQTAVDAAEAEGADYVIALGHLGDDYSASPWTSEEVIQNTDGIDAFIDGHSHSTVEHKVLQNKDGEDVVLTQTGCYLAAVGEMTIEADGTIDTELVTSYGEYDESVCEKESEWINKVEESLGKTIAETDINFRVTNTEGTRLVRKYETNLGDLNADAFYYYINQNSSGCDVAFINGGGVRADVDAGTWTYKTAKTVNPFGNELCVISVTGQQILDALEFGSRMTPDVETGGFLHTAGLTYKVDTSIENNCQVDSTGIWTGGPDTYRVHDVQVYNKTTGAYEPLDLTKTYKLGGITYTLLNKGDGFNMFEGSELVGLLTCQDYMAFADYVSAFTDTDGNGIPNISSASSPFANWKGYLLNYEDINGAGRITVEVPEKEETEWDQKVTIGGTELNVWFTKYGNTYTDCTVEHFMGTDDNGFGFEYGDIVEVSFNDQVLDLPVVSNYSDVDAGEGCIRIADGASYVELAINMGNFGSTYGLVDITKDANNQTVITGKTGVSYPVTVTFKLDKKGGYSDQLIMHRLSRTNNREDYPELSDAQFANFRQITTTGMGDNLYRSSSPINSEIGRNTYADAALEAAGITKIINLSDDLTTAESYEGYADTNYSAKQKICLNLGVDVRSNEFKLGLAKGLKFMASVQGKYLIHCNEGKDRAGFVSALLECFMGATYDEVEADYMVSYYNYYGVEPGTDKYYAIANSNIYKTLNEVFGVEDCSSSAVNLAAEAEEYMKEAGLTDQDITDLRHNLAPQD